jgi:hypothetical protein
MARSTFEGPILSGDNRFGALRDVGYTELCQGVDLVLTNTTVGTAGYSGASGQFVWSNNIPNLNGQLYTPNSTYSASGPVTTSPTADSATAVFRGAVFYLPVGCNINDVIVDVGVVPTETSGTISSITLNIGNQFNGSQYASTTISATGRQTMTYTAANIQSTTADIQNPTLGANPSFLSQVVATLDIAGTGLTGPITAGSIYVTIRYTQPDNNIGTLTTYPYGNLD